KVESTRAHSRHVFRPILGRRHQAGTTGTAQTGRPAQARHAGIRIGTGRVIVVFLTGHRPLWSHNQ
ncbi:MAG: hypothetical protein NNA22_11765, partial [Nitrospira sp.]|nr:hypothetical protein [Nitrospira sp.]